MPKYSDLLAETGKLTLRLGVSIRRMLEALRRDLKSAERGLPRVEDLVASPRQRLDHVSHRLDGALRSRVQRSHTRFAQVAGRLPSPRSLVSHHRQRIDTTSLRLGRALYANTQSHHTRHARIAARLSPTPIRLRLERCNERLEALSRRAGRAITLGLAQRRNTLESHGKLLGSLGYHSVLARGFSLVRDANGATVRSAATIAAGQALEIEFADGRIDAEAKSSTLASPAKPKAAEKPASQSPKRSPGDQGSLF